MATYIPQQGVAYDPNDVLPDMPVDNPGQLERGFRSALRNAAASSAASDYYNAAVAGDQPATQRHGLRVQDYAQQAQAVAPRVQSVGDIRGLGDWLDWGAGVLGAAPVSMVGPMGAGLAAGILGRRFGPGVSSAGSMLGSAAGMYPETRDAARLQQLQAEQQGAPVLAPQQVLDDTAMQGAVQAGLEGMVPGLAARSLVGQGAKAVLTRPVQSTLQRVGRDTALDAGMGAASEYAATGFESGRNPGRDTSGDAMRYVDAAAGEAVVGGVHGAIGHAGDMAHTALGTGLDVGGAVAEAGGKATMWAGGKTAEAAADAWENRPRSAADAAIALGTGAAKLRTGGEDMLTRAMQRGKDADVDALLSPAQDKTPQGLMQDDAAKHAAASSLLDKIVARPDAFPQYVQEAAGRYGNTKRETDDWRTSGLADAVNDWKRSETIGEGFTEFSQKLALTTGKAMAKAANAAERTAADVRDGVNVGYDDQRAADGRANAQAPRRNMTPDTLARVDDLRDEFSPLLEKAIAPYTGLHAPLAQAENVGALGHGLREWIANGFSIKKGGKVVVPDGLLQMFADPVGAVAVAHDLMQRQGIVGTDSAARMALVARHIEVKQEAVKHIGSIVEDNMLPTAQAKYGFSGARHEAAGRGMQRALLEGRPNEKVVEELFGPKALLVMDALRAKYEAEHASYDEHQPADAQVDNTADATEMTNGLDPNVVESRTKFHHYRDLVERKVDADTGEILNEGAAAVPFIRKGTVQNKDGSVTQHDEAAATRAETLTAKNGSSVRQQGYMDYLRETYSGQELVDRMVRTMAEHKGLIKDLTKAEKELNDKLYVLREEQASDKGEATDVHPDTFKSVDPHSKSNVWAEHVTLDKARNPVGGLASEGKVWLERADGKRFATSTNKIIMHVSKGNRAEGGTGGADSEHSGLAGQVRMLRQGLASMLAAAHPDGEAGAYGKRGAQGAAVLKNRIGFREVEGGPIKWLQASDDLPESLRMHSSDKATYGDAKAQAQIERIQALRASVQRQLAVAAPYLKADIKAAINAKVDTKQQRNANERELNRLQGQFDQGQRESTLKYADEQQSTEPSAEAKGPRSLHEDVGPGGKARTTEPHTGEAIGEARRTPSDARKAARENAALGSDKGSVGRGSEGQRTTSGNDGSVRADSARAPTAPATKERIKNLYATRSEMLNQWHALNDRFKDREPPDSAVKRLDEISAAIAGIDETLDGLESVKAAAISDTSSAPKINAEHILSTENYDSLKTVADVDEFLRQAHSMWENGADDRSLQADLNRMFDAGGYASTDLASFYDGLKGGNAELDHDTLMAQLKGGTRNNSQNPKHGMFGTEGAPATEAEQTKFVADAVRRLGPSIQALVEKELFGTRTVGKTTVQIPISGDWTKGVIRASLFSHDISQIGAHEAMHEFFSRLTEAGANKVMDVLLKAANSAPVVRQLERLLDGQAAALAQIADGAEHAAEERLAYMFQFHQAGLLTVGPETKTVFQKIWDTLRAVAGLLSDDQQADMLLRAFNDGKAQTADAANAVLSEHAALRKALYANVNAVYQPMLERASRLVNTTETNLERTGNPVYHEIRTMFKRSVGESGKQGFLDAKDHQMKMWFNKVAAVFEGLNPKDLELAATYLHTGAEPTDRVVKDIVAKLKGPDGILPAMHQYLKDAGVQLWVPDAKDPEQGSWQDMGHIKDYYPRAYDTAKIIGNPGAFITDLLNYNGKELQAAADAFNAAAAKAGADGLTPKTAEDVAKAITNRLTNTFGQEMPDNIRADADTTGKAELKTSESSVGFTPFMQSVNRRSLHWISDEILAKYGEKDVAKTITSYVAQGVKRAEYVRRFGNTGEKLQQMLKDGHEQQLKHLIDGGMDPDKAKIKALKIAKGVATDVMALEGTLGYNINPTIRRINNSALVYENIRVLSTSLFSQFIDPMGLVVRGATMGDAWNAYKRGMREVVSSIKDDSHVKDHDSQVAELVGTVDSGNMLAAFGQLYSSQYMGAGFRKANDLLFKYNGMEGFNRGMQVSATRAAIGFIKRHTQKPGPNSEAYLAELNLKASDVTVDANGELDYTDPRIKEAIHQWVNGSVLRPNAAQRPAWGSDPHYMMFWHMKQFAYTFHDVIMKRAMHDFKKYGDLGPAGILVGAFTPIMIASDAMKSILLTGSEPTWMKAGLASELEHGAMRAGLAGKFQPIVDVATNPHRSVLGLGGPVVEQITQMFSDTPQDTLVNALPGANVWNTIGGKSVVTAQGED